MKIFNLLYETRALDVFTTPFKDFLSKYDSIYSRDLFVIFADNSTFRVHNRELPVDGVVMFPIADVVKHPENYTDYAMNKFLYVVRPDGNGLNMKTVSLMRCRSLANDMGLSDDEFKIVMTDVAEKYSGTDPSTEAYLFKYLLTHKITFENEKPSYKKVTSARTTKRLRTMGYTYVYQNASQPSESVLGKDATSIGISMKTTGINIVDEYELQLVEKEDGDAPEDDGMNNAYFTDRDYMRRIAGEVAVGLGTKLNNDQPFSMFLDHFFWTVDGIEIKVTAAFSGNSSENSDSVYYVIDADTPFGLLIKNINSHTPIDKISDIIKQVYATFTTPNNEWRPSNRDVFLDGERREYKFFDVQKEDLSAVVNDFYPVLYQFAYRNSIKVPPLTYFSNFEKVFINQFIEFLASNPTPPTQLMKRMEEAEHDINELFFSPLPDKISQDLLNRIAMVYELRKKIHPSRSGWHLFKE